MTVLTLWAFKPLLQVIFLIFNGWVLVFTLIDRPLESLFGLGVLLFGMIIYYFDKPSQADESTQNTSPAAAEATLSK